MRENAPVFFETEVVRLDRAGDLHINQVIQQDGAEYKTLSIRI
jgi:hypothetical protein